MCFRTNFLVDLLSALPTDILVLASWTRDISEGIFHVFSEGSSQCWLVTASCTGDVMRVLSMSRLNRLLRFYKVVGYQLSVISCLLSLSLSLSLSLFLSRSLPPPLCLSHSSPLLSHSPTDSLSHSSLWPSIILRVRLDEMLGPLRKFPKPNSMAISLHITTHLVACMLTSFTCALIFLFIILHVTVLVSALHSEVKLALYMIVGTHLMACGWFILACSSLTASAGDPHTCSSDSWAMQMSSLDGTTKHLSMCAVCSDAC